MTLAWWIHLANYILQYPYQKHRPHISVLVTQPTSPCRGGCLGTSARDLRGALWNWRTECLQLVLRVTWTSGETWILSAQWSWAWGPMFWYRHKRPDQGQEVILLQAFWEIKGPRAAVSRLSENQVQAASCILPASDAWPQVPNHRDQQEGKKKQGYICTAGTSAEDGQPDHVRNQSPLNQSPAPLIPFFKRLSGLWAAPAQTKLPARPEGN